MDLRLQTVLFVPFIESSQPFEPRYLHLSLAPLLSYKFISNPKSPRHRHTETQPNLFLTPWPTMPSPSPPLSNSSLESVWLQILQRPTVYSSTESWCRMSSRSILLFHWSESIIGVAARSHCIHGEAVALAAAVREVITHCCNRPYVYQEMEVNGGEGLEACRHDNGSLLHRCQH